MAYVEAHASLREHPKMKRLIRTLGISRVQAIGHLMCLWWWCQEYAEDGDLSRYSDDDIADAAEWTGESQKFVDALETCGAKNGVGFLVRGEDSSLFINDWEEYGGKISIQRKQARERMRNKRNRDKDVTRNLRVTESDVTRKLHDVTDIDQTRQDQTRSDKIDHAENAENAENGAFGQSVGQSVSLSVAALLKTYGLNPTQYRIEQYSNAIGEYGLEMVKAGLTAAANRGQEKNWKYVRGCIENIIAESGKPAATNNGAANGVIDLTNILSDDIARLYRANSND